MTVGVLMFPLQIFEMSRGIQPIKMSNLKELPYMIRDTTKKKQALLFI